MQEIKRLILYLGRWQLSSFVLAPILSLMTNTEVYDLRVILATIVANLVGGCIFYWVDRWIFRKKELK